MSYTPAATRGLEKGTLEASVILARHPLPASELRTLRRRVGLTQANRPWRLASAQAVWLAGSAPFPIAQVAPYLRSGGDGVRAAPRKVIE